MDKEELAFNLTKLYFTEIIQRRHKRKIDLDTVIKAYRYVSLELKR